MLLSHVRATVRVAVQPEADEPMGQLRARVERFLVGEGAFRTLHDRRTRASLGEHLLGTFDLLAARRCSGAVCTAGALHSIYGTNVFRHATVQPTRARRDAIGREFGWRAERLAYLFHTCSRPHDLERGALVSRTPGLVWSERDLHDLRMIEGANLAEQGHSFSRFPTIGAIWARASSVVA